METITKEKQEFKISDIIGPVTDKLVITESNRFTLYRMVCTYYGFTIEQVNNKTRKREIVQVRQIAMVLYHLFCKISLAEIGHICGDKDHATILHARRTISNLLDTHYGNLRNEFVELSRKIRIMIQDQKDGMAMDVIYIAHPIGADPEGNVKKVLEIVKQINELHDNVVPFAPYLPDVLALDDNNPKHRSRGIRNDHYLLRSGIITAVWLYGDRISKGMIDEIRIAIKRGIPIKAQTYETLMALEQLYEEGVI